MATCKDCVHFELCLPNSQAYGHKLKLCSKFKDKADVMEVVRCKNCQQYNTNSCADGFGWCEHFNAGTVDEHFCSYGERGEEK